MSEACRSILVVEDDESIREVMKSCLEFEGYNVVTANNGQMALDVLKDLERPCLILLDLMMPVMDGWTFLQKRSSSEALMAIPVAVVSAAADKALSAASGVQAVLKKPVDLNALLDRVKSYCH